MSSIQKKASLNAVTSKKGIMKQQRQKNSTTNSSKGAFRKQRSKEPHPTIHERENKASEVRLPKIVKKQSTRKDDLQDLLQYQTTSLMDLTSFSFTRSLGSIIIPTNMPPMNDRVIKQNLTQKAILRRASPQPHRIFSRSSTYIGAELQEEKTVNGPLKHMDINPLLTESARNRLKRLFNKLDTDKDGHISYPQLQRCLPASFPRAQLTFFHVLYDVISCTTFFGLQEFYAIAIIVEMIAKQNSTLWNHLLNDVDFNYYHDHISELLERFNDQCLVDAKTINYEELLKFLKKRLTQNGIERISNELEYALPNIKTMRLNRLDFIALMPTIIYVESSLAQGRTLFRFQENSLLNLHMQRALVT